MNNYDEMWKTLHSNGLTNFLDSQNKKHLVITGRRGVGKTTLFDSLCPPNGPGLKTYARWSNGPTPDDIVMEDRVTGKTAILGLPGNHRMTLCPQALETVGLPALQRSSVQFFLDEIGYLECSHETYCQGILSLLDTTSLIAVLRKEDTYLSRKLLTHPLVYVLDLDDYR